MNQVIILIAIIALAFSVYNYFQITREKKRNRILQSFIAGLIKSISDYKSETDIENIVSAKDIIKKNIEMPLPYKVILDNIESEFLKDFYMDPYKKWITNDRLLFDDKKYGNDGFNFIYLDFFDKQVKEWNSKK
jgi:hypothetical protein